MGETRQVLVPDIGDFKEVPIIEIQVKPGDRIVAEAPLITLESDKAAMEVPSPASGSSIVTAIVVLSSPTAWASAVCVYSPVMAVDSTQWWRGDSPASASAAV